MRCIAWCWHLAGASKRKQAFWPLDTGANCGVALERVLSGRLGDVMNSRSYDEPVRKPAAEAACPGSLESISDMLTINNHE